ncbi:MAG: VOC family protein [Candidatus Riflebacteria bacterium]|nr:VOC family protein [Candidatus Riflebacteria bacterium]
MLTRIYRYKIREGSEKRYLQLQEDVLVLYRSHAEVEVLLLRDAKDSTQRTEVVRFSGADASSNIQRIDSDPAIQKLFTVFKGEILDPQNSEITEETCVSEALSSAGKLHHVEIYCSDLKKTEEFWAWFLSVLGYKQYQKWPDGVSFKLSDTYLVFVQAEGRHLATPFHRCRPGLNHLAFHATSRQQVDEISSQLRERGAVILYEDRHPHAAGPEFYAVFFEDPERLKVELASQ